MGNLIEQTTYIGAFGAGLIEEPEEVFEAGALVLDLTTGEEYKPLAEESEPCSDHSDCASGWCEAARCVNLRAHGETCTMSAVEFAGFTGSELAGLGGFAAISVVPLINNIAAA